MKLSIIGLGKMGANMTRRLLADNHEVVVYDMNPEPVKQLEKEGAIAASGLENIVEQLPSPRVVWMMIPAGDPVKQTAKKLSSLLEKGDILIDGGNSNFNDTVELAEQLASEGIGLLDAGTSGGVWGLEVGYCLMVGGTKEAFEKVEPAFKTLAPKDGYLHVGESGAGHYVKMIHNGIEYGIMQAYAEGFDMLEHSQFSLNLPGIAGLWNQGSVIRSWLLELSEIMLKENNQLEGIKGYVPDSGEGRWTVEESIKLRIPTPVITASLQARFRSRRENTFSDRFLAALRNQFGGHAMKKVNE